MKGSRLFDPKPDRTHLQASVGQGMSMLRMCSDCNQRRSQLGGKTDKRTKLWHCSYCEVARALTSSSKAAV